MDAILGKLAEALIAMVNEDLAYIVLGTLVLTQASKWVMTYTWRSPPGPVIWFAISPACAVPVAAYTWSYGARVPWFVVALAASVLANVLFALLGKHVLGKLAPGAYERVNYPIERRRGDNATPLTERRGSPR